MGDNSFRQCELVHTARPLFVRGGAYGDVVPAHSVGSPPSCGEGLGVGVVVLARGACLTTTPTRLASLATLPTRGRVGPNSLLAAHEHALAQGALLGGCELARGVARQALDQRVGRHDIAESEI